MGGKWAEKIHNKFIEINGKFIEINDEFNEFNDGLIEAMKYFNKFI